jgi:hypothetical protein
MEHSPFSLNITSAAKAITATSTNAVIPGGEGEQLRVYNVGPNLVSVYASRGNGTAVFPTDNATPNGTGVVIPVGGVEIVTMPFGADTLNAICPAAGTATIYLSRGKGN